MSPAAKLKGTAGSSTGAVMSANTHSVGTQLASLSGPIQLTKWTAPHPVTKRLRLRADNTVEKTSTAAQLYEGQLTQVACLPAQFVDLIKKVGPNECLSYGVPIDNAVTRVMSRRKFNAAGSPAGVMTRTNANMTWPQGSAIFMLDYDPVGAAKQPVALLNDLYAICAPLEQAAHIWAASASSCLKNCATGAVVRGIEGQRVSVVVTDGTDIPRAGKVLAKRAWLHGHGHIKVSTTGSALVRSLIDEAVFQPTRIDFCAPAICEAPLKQTKPAPKLYGDKNLALNTREALPDLTAAEEALYRRLVADAKAARAPEMAAAKAAYRSEQVTLAVARGLSTGDAERMISRALDTSVLTGNFELTTAAGQMVTVAELLGHRNHWHGKQFADPMEPAYHGDCRIAKAYLIGTGLPSIYSYAHGGRRYALECRDHLIRIEEGARHEYVNKIIDVFNQQESFFSRSGSLATVDQDGRLCPVAPNALRAAIDRTIRLEHFKAKKWRPTDAPFDLAKPMCDAYASSFLPISAVLTAPCIEPVTGRLVTTSGYDACR